MTFMSFDELKKAINSVTTEYSVRGPFHEDDGNFHALLRGEWVGNGFETRRQALQAIYDKLHQERAA
ncbi:hypothetical protein JDT53_12545 [Escherichia coli]|nr:hypothetical protein [Escherichia coli]EJS6324267.1 hypothetical protein [Escherichia coli]EKM0761542.1 hypothetical protein [Escherichia coli]EKQ6353132.1 hypothetical protein [Escherichia coli]ELI4584679.1 hypothetical protein [Escherichia coli]